MTAKPKTIGFGFTPAETEHHFLVTLPSSSHEPVYISEHANWDDSEARRELTSALGAEDAAMRVILPRSKWEAIADIVRVQFNQRLKAQKRKTGKWKRGQTPISRLFGKELVLLAWAIEDADPALIPAATQNWLGLAPEERFYLKGLDLERHGEYRAGAYQELARGFGIKDYKFLFDSSKANQTRLKTASEFGAKVLGSEGFGASLVRHALFPVRETTRTGKTRDGKDWLRTEGAAYWQQRKNLITILRYLSDMGRMMPHWQNDANSARLLAGALENDSA